MIYIQGCKNDLYIRTLFCPLIQIGNNYKKTYKVHAKNKKIDRYINKINQ